MATILATAQEEETKTIEDHMGGGAREKLGRNQCIGESVVDTEQRAMCNS